MKIGSVDLDANVLIVAEIGNNHEGDFNLASRLIYEAAACKVDAVKFQTYKTELFINPSEYERYKRLKSFELSNDQFDELAQLSRSLGLIFISTPLDIHSAHFLERIVDAYKISSSDNSFQQLIEIVSKKNKPIIISTGMSTYQKLTETISFIRSVWNHAAFSGELALLHCVSCYPVPDEDVNLLSITGLQESFPYPIGYSDHTLGIEASVYAAVLGARIIEKHFTINKNYSSFRDHQLSADPMEMKELVRRVRGIPVLLGKKDKKVHTCEDAALISVQRSCTLTIPVTKGTVIDEQMITWTRPGCGIPPEKTPEIIGKKVLRNLKAGEMIMLHDLETSIE